MMNNPSPEGSGNEWNSEKIAIDNLSCKQLAALSTAFLGAFRLINPDRKEFGPVGVMKAVHRLLGHHIDLLECEDMPDGVKDLATEVAAISVLSICMAATASIEKIDPRHLSTLAVTLIESAIELAKKTGPIGPDDVVLVDARVRDGDDGEGLNKVELGMRLESADEIDELASNSEIGKAIKKLVDEETRAKDRFHGSN